MISDKINIFNKKFFLNFFFGLIISFIFIYYSLQNFNVYKFFRISSQINYSFILASIFFLIFSVYLRAIRWKTLLNNKIQTNFLYKAQLIGYFGNNIFPLRFGELLKSYFVSIENNTSISKVFGSVILERTLDMLGAGILLLFLLVFNKNYLILIDNYIFYSIILMFLIGIIGSSLSVFKKKNIFLKSKNRFLIIIKDIYTGFSSLNISNILKVFFITLIIWLIYILNVYLLQSAFHLNLSINQCIVLLLISTVALAIPALPGSFGTFEGSIVYSLSLFNLTDDFGFSFMMHAASYIPYTFLGFIYFMEQSKKIKKFSSFTTNTIK